MTLCYKCGSPIAFKKLDSGRFCPTNVDGTDHWDDCKRITYLASGRPLTIKGKRTKSTDEVYVYAGKLPPWDESLGDYRSFTDAEKQTQEVCVRNP